MEDPITHDSLHAILAGRVQGVGFRWFVQQEAAGLGVAGTVRNMRDGRVEVWAEGEQDTLVSFVGVIVRGPTHGRVDRMHVQWGGASGRWQDFDIIT